MIPRIVRARDGHVLLDPETPDETLRDGRRVWWISWFDLRGCRTLRRTLEFQIGLVESGNVPDRAFVRFEEPEGLLPPIVAV